MNTNPAIIYTKTDEAPALATRSLLPILRKFLQTADIRLELKDISLAGRLLAAFPERLSEDQRIEDALVELGRMVKQPDAQIIKLPNISASTAQLIAAVEELRAKGYDLPPYPEEPKDETEREIKERYDTVKGSAVNPVIRMGNSDRRVPRAVKAYARSHPHSMGTWRRDSKTHVSSMQRGDFYESEKSLTLNEAVKGSIELHAKGGEKTTLKEGLALQAGEVLDTAVMHTDELRSFISAQLTDAKERGVLFSIHLKATMMKVSDPIIFGHVVSVFFEEVFRTHQKTFEKLGIIPDTGMSSLLAKLSSLPENRRREIEADIQSVYAKQPELAMVNSDRGISNLHVPSDIIVDASMPAAIRAGGKMYAPDGSMKDMKALIPDRCYAGIYAETIDFCKKNGAFDPAIMGSVSNVGLMAEKAEEYGSHDKTFKILGDGVVRIADESGAVLLEQEVKSGDIFRACRTKDIPIRDWVKLAVARARESGDPAVFWLDSQRAHDREIIRKVELYLKEHNTEGLEIEIMAPSEATRLSLERMKEGKNTISVTGNVLRDYLTDLFPILEVGTSAKMLSIVPLIEGGGLYETGAGGSAPKHVQQFVQEGHLRWDSLGEFLAVAACLDRLAKKHGNGKIAPLAESLDRAVTRFLEENRSPSRKAGEIDNRGSHYYLARYWAEALAEQSGASTELSGRFAALAEELRRNEKAIIGELEAAQGSSVDIGGYYLPDEEKAEAAMRPSPTLNAILARH